MKSIDDYTILCTKEQIKKALKLGAPIKKEASSLSLYGCARLEEKDSITGMPYWLMPITAEQMIGWLEEQEGIKSIEVYRNCDYWGYGVNITTYDVNKHFSSRKEATLAAIDAALDYLTKNKK